MIPSLPRTPRTALILGSGWNRVIDRVKVIKWWDYSDIFSVKSTVPGHQGKLIYGTLAKKPVLIMSGRFHIYEGHSAVKAVEPIQLLKKLGVNTLITTSACGGLNPKYQVGDYVILNDLLTLFSPTPLVGAKFQDMSQIYDSRLQKIAENAMTNLQLNFHKGIYVYYHGPQYETPADKIALRHLGADIVGMSTVPETTMAHHLGIKVLGLALVTNLAFVKHDHRDVLAQSEKASAKMSRLLERLLDLL
ncbi:MAG: purine-nucleoside phosphorylase [Candidatus Beckwithbacteria bacterium]|nr:purine-nucleoside phosphorylase [Candidatus Beckwithbacteria bacterium]